VVRVSHWDRTFSARSREMDEYEIELRAEQIEQARDTAMRACERASAELRKLLHDGNAAPEAIARAERRREAAARRRERLDQALESLRQSQERALLVRTTRATLHIRPR